MYTTIQYMCAYKYTYIHTRVCIFAYTTYSVSLGNSDWSTLCHMFQDASLVCCKGVWKMCSLVGGGAGGALLRVQLKILLPWKRRKMNIWGQPGLMQNPNRFKVELFSPTEDSSTKAINLWSWKSHWYYTHLRKTTLTVQVSCLGVGEE